MSISDITNRDDLSKENLLVKIEFIGNLYFEEISIVEDVPMLIEFDVLGQLKISICPNKVIPLDYDTCKNIVKHTNATPKLFESGVYERTMFCTCDKIKKVKPIDFSTNDFFHYNIKGYDGEYEYIVNDIIFNESKSCEGYYCTKYFGSIGKECIIQNKKIKDIDSVICDCFGTERFPINFNISDVYLEECKEKKILDLTFMHRFIEKDDLFHKNIENIISFLTGYKFLISIKRYFNKEQIVKYVIKPTQKEINYCHSYFVLSNNDIDNINYLINNTQFMNSLNNKFFELTIYYLTFLTKVDELNIKWAILLMSLEFFLNGMLLEKGETTENLEGKNFSQKICMLNGHIRCIKKKYCNNNIIRVSYRNALFHEGSIDMALSHDNVWNSFNEYRDLLYQLIMRYIGYDGEFNLASKGFTLGKIFD